MNKFKNPKKRYYDYSNVAQPLTRENFDRALGYLIDGSKWYIKLSLWQKILYKLGIKRFKWILR